MSRYLAITPARDEEKLLPGLIASMASQSHLPSRWIIIDDGSADDTPAILDEAARRYPWMEVHRLERNRPRAAGGESVIMRFLPRETWKQYDYVLRLDADLSFASDLVELLLDEFVRDPALGIAGAILYEPDRDGWREIRVPQFHTRGAVKMYSAQCFLAIGGLEAGLGWDTVDEAHAMMLGYKTRSFRHIHAQHHRPQGSASKAWRGHLASGRAAYRSGYSAIFMVARVFRRLRTKPFGLASVMMLAGFCEGYLRKAPRAASPELVRFIRRQQVRRLLMQESLWR